MLCPEQDTPLRGCSVMRQLENWKRKDSSSRLCLVCVLVTRTSSRTCASQRAPLALNFHTKNMWNLVRPCPKYSLALVVRMWGVLGAIFNLSISHSEQTHIRRKLFYKKFHHRIILNTQSIIYENKKILRYD